MSTVQGLADAVDRLGKALAAQRVLWVEGELLPDEIELSDPDGPIALAGP